MSRGTTGKFPLTPGVSAVGARPRGWFVLRWVVFGVMAAAAALLIGMHVAFANGVPVRVKLSWLDGISNWGPRSATGEAELVLSEGTGKFAVSGLPRLAGNQVYQLWVINQTTHAVKLLSEFNVDAS